MVILSIGVQRRLFAVSLGLLLLAVWNKRNGIRSFILLRRPQKLVDDNVYCLFFHAYESACTTRATARGCAQDAKWAGLDLRQKTCRITYIFGQPLGHWFIDRRPAGVIQAIEQKINANRSSNSGGLSRPSHCMPTASSGATEPAHHPPRVPGSCMAKRPYGQTN